MYSTEEYGTTGYSQEEQISDEEIKSYKPDLLYRLPPHLKEISEFKSWGDVSSYELGLSAWQEEDILNQCFVDTATWGLVFWESIFNITTDLNKSYEDRRAVIKAKLRGSGTTTRQMIKNTAEAFSGGECDVIMHPEDNSFTVQFIGIKGIPKNLEDFKHMLEDIKPAHLGYYLKYTYTVWDFLKNENLTWGQAKPKTWNDLRVYDE
ncbi:YmfQ family protein [Clostridium sp.]|uniref:YmfQ family protein n=1 Tax=Clostridium sp. TaxID=1506 RepID=UPI00359F1B34